MQRTISKPMTLASVALLGVVFVATMMLSTYRVEAEGFPSAKAAVAIDPLIALSQAVNGAAPTATAGDTG